MSAHYAMCKYDDATGSYIPLEVRPITDKLKKDDPLYQEGFQAGAASRDAEVVSLTNQRDYEYVRAENAEHDKLLVKTAAKDAEIERKMSAGQFVLEQLAAEQAKNAGLREAYVLLENFAQSVGGSSSFLEDFNDKLEAASVIANFTQSDTSALEAMIAKAGEKMRERVVETILASAHGFPMREIRALPGVTLDDLKGGA